jgi:hypothetical protein
LHEDCIDTSTKLRADGFERSHPSEPKPFVRIEDQVGKDESWTRVLKWFVGFERT